MNDWDTENLVAEDKRHLWTDMILAKALTEWYLPLAITLLTEQIFSTLAASPDTAILEVCGDKAPTQ